MPIPDPIQDRRKEERHVGRRRVSDTELLLELQHQADESCNLMFKHLQRSATGAEQCCECGEFYLRPAIHICVRDSGDSR